MGGRVVAGLAIAAGLLAVALVVRSKPAEPATPVERANLAFTLDDMNGAKVDLSKFGGKPLIINLWATWCGPCRLETPQLQALSEKFKSDGVTIIGVSVDDKPEAIREFAAEYKVTYPMLVGIGQEPFLKAMGYEDPLPLSILIKADGTIVERHIGLKTTEDWERMIRALF